MRLIDADKLQKAIPAEEDNITGIGMTYDEMEAYNDGIDEQWKKIVNAPTIETELIRCKDCKNWDTTWQNDWAKNYHYCPLIDGTRNGDWYCADAERRTDEERWTG